MDLPTYYDPSAATVDAIKPLINLQGFPTTLLLDRGGVIRAVWEGYWPGAETEMERSVDAVLDERREERGEGRGKREEIR